VQGIIRDGSRLDAGHIFANTRLIFSRHKMNTTSASESVTTCPPCVQDHFYAVALAGRFLFRLEVRGFRQSSLLVVILGGHGAGVEVAQILTSSRLVLSASAADHGFGVGSVLLLGQDGVPVVGMPEITRCSYAPPMPSSGTIDIHSGLEPNLLV
jgi:hypothetical protein